MGADPAEKGRRRSFPTLLALLLVLAVGFRLALVLRDPYRSVDSDEAISGIMAQHILEGRELPVFFYGQAYGGTLEAYIGAAVFALFGVSAAGLKIISLGFFALFFITFYFYARKVAGRGAALLGCAFLALPPPYFTEFSFKAGGLYATTFLFGTMVLLLTERAVGPRAGWKTFLLLGISMGVAIWLHLLAVVYVIPALLTLALRLGRRGLLRALAPMGIGCIPGLLPLVVYNLIHRGETAGFLVDRIGLSSAQKRFWDVFAEGGPTILGVREHLDPQLFYPLIGPAVGIIWAACLGIYLCRGLGACREGGRWVWRRERVETGALLLVTLPFILAPTGFQVFATNPRYMTPCYSVLPLALGSVAALGWSIRKWSRWIVCVGLGLIALLQIWGNLDRWKGGLLWQGREADHRQIIETLRSLEIRHLYTNYWIGYRLALESGGEIVPSPFQLGVPGEFPSEERYPPFTQEVRSREESSYLLWSDIGPLFEDLVAAHAEVGARTVRVDPFVLFTSVRPQGAYGRPGVLLRDKTDFRLRLPEGEEGRETLLDSDLATAWRTREAPPAGVSMDLLLPEALPLSGLDLALRIHPVDLGGGQRVPIPPGLRVLVSADGETFEEAKLYPDRQAIIDEALVNGRPLRAVPYRIFIPLGGIVGRAVRLEVISSPRWPWEIAEVDVYRSP